MKFTPGSRDVDMEAAIADSLIIHEERPVITAMVRELQAAASPTDFYGLQHQLLTRAYARQQVTSELAGQIKNTKKRLGELTAQRPFPQTEVMRTQEQLANLELTERCCKAAAHALRCVGDGIA